MISSRFLSQSELTALTRIGDIYLPGNEIFPSFSKLGCLAHVDAMLEQTDSTEIRKLKLLLKLLQFTPTGMLRWLFESADAAYMKSGLIYGSLRELEFGIGGMVKSLYFSGKCGHDYAGPMPLELIGFDRALSTVK